MSDELSDELVDAAATFNSGEAPQAVKTLSILSIAGNSLMMLLILIGLLYILALGGSAGGLMRSAIAGAMGGLVISALLGITLNVLGLIAAIKLGKGENGGFIMYAIVTGIWSLLLLFSGLSNGNILGIVIGLSSAGFIVAFGLQMKNMPR